MMSDSYDLSNRLLSETKKDITDVVIYAASFTYDTAGNRLTKTENGVTTDYTYNNLDQLVSENNGGQITFYAYNALGQLTRKTNPDGSFTDHIYNEISKLAQTTTSTGDVTTLEYDAQGNLAAKTVNDTTTHYLVDSQQRYPEVLAEYDESGQSIAVYTFGHDLIKMRRAGVDSFYQSWIFIPIKMVSDASKAAGTAIF